jgi:3-dehydroquinate synthase class II
LKELWVEITSNASEKDKLLKLATDNADFLLEDTYARNHSGKDEITVLNSFDANAITQLKQNGKKIALKITIKGKEDENTAVKAAELSADYIIINCLDWRVIPLENLIARTRGKS